MIAKSFEVFKDLLNLHKRKVCYDGGMKEGTDKCNWGVFFQEVAQKIWRLVLKNWHYLVVLVFGIIVTMGVWGALRNTIQADDIVFHSVRLRSSVHAWTDGQIIPQVDPRAADGLGYAYGIFYGPLPTYLAAALRLLTSSWTVIVNVIYILCMIGSGIAMCYVVNKISKHKVAAAMAGILYLAEPYHILNLYSRMALGEVAAMAIAPMLFLGLYQLVNHQKGAVRNIVITASCLVLTHSLSAVMFALVAIGFLLLNIKKVWNVKSFGQMAVMGLTILGLTAFFTLPMMEAKVLGNYGIFDAEYSASYFGANPGAVHWQAEIVPPSQTLWSSYSPEKTTLQNLAIGATAIVVLLGFPFLRKKILNVEERRFVTSLYVITIVAILMTTPLVKWEWMPSFLYSIQFPWRFLEVSCVTVSMIAGYMAYLIMREVSEERQKVLVIVLGLLVLYPSTDMFTVNTSKHWPIGMIPPAVLTNGSAGWQVEYAPMELICGEGVPNLPDCGIEVIQYYVDERGREVEVVDGDVKVGEVVRDGTRTEFVVQNAEAGTIEIPLIWYPGYQAVMDGEKLEVKPSERLGFVAVVVPAESEGKIVRVKYGMSLATKAGVVITGITGLIWLGVGINMVRKRGKVKGNMV